MIVVRSLYFLVLLTNACFSIQKTAQAPTKQEQLAYLNQQIKQLEDERDKYIAKAARAQNQGDRLQFENNMLYEARRYWQVAQSCQEIADKIDQQISILKKQRQQLLEETQAPISHA